MLMYEAWKYIKVPDIFVDMSGFCPFKFNTDNCTSLVRNDNIIFFLREIHAAIGHLCIYFLYLEKLVGVPIRQTSCLLL